MEKQAKQSVLEKVATSKASMIVAGVAILACLMAGGFLVMPTVLADNSLVDSVQITVPTSCTMGSKEDTPHVETLINGQAKSGIGQTTIKAWCNDAAGYAIFAVGAGNNEDGNTYMISNIKSDYDIQTGTNTGSGNSSWAMKLTAGTGSDTVTTPPVIDSDTEGSFASYHTVPNIYKRVAYRTAGTNMETDVTKSGSYLTTTYQVYANGTQPAGTYVGQVKYAMVHPYDAQSSTLVSLELAFKNAYGTNNKLPVHDGDTKTYYTMQSMTPSICNAVTIIGEASQTQLIDARDRKLYWATKLEDGNCWMTQNLDLDIETTATLNEDNTNIAHQDTVAATGPYSATGGYSNVNSKTTWTPSTATVTTLSSSTFPNGDQDATSFYTPHSFDSGDFYENGTWFESASCNYFTNPTGCTNFSATPFATNGTHGHVGNYYNYTASIASNNAQDYVGNASNSVCPKGWTLPIDGEYGTLNDIYNGGKTGSGDQGMDKGLFNAPLYLVRAGYVNGGSLSGAGYYGDYWSSTAGSSTGARYLDFSSTYVYPAYIYYRWYGFSLRCVAHSSY